MPLVPLVVLRAVLNGPGGIAFGYLDVTRGLGCAKISHFAGDIMLHVLFGW